MSRFPARCAASGRRPPCGYAAPLRGHSRFHNPSARRGRRRPRAQEAGRSRDARVSEAAPAHGPHDAAPSAIEGETPDRERVETADAEPYVAPEESLPAEVIAEATVSAGGASGENTE